MYKRRLGLRGSHTGSEQSPRLTTWMLRLLLGSHAALKAIYCPKKGFCDDDIAEYWR